MMRAFRSRMKRTMHICAVSVVATRKLTCTSLAEPPPRDAPALGGVWSGSNDLGTGDCSLCAAGGFYNDATGLGRPDVTSLVAAF